MTMQHCFFKFSTKTRAANYDLKKDTTAAPKTGTWIHFNKQEEGKDVQT